MLTATAERSFEQQVEDLVAGRVIDRNQITDRGAMNLKYICEIDSGEKLMVRIGRENPPPRVHERFKKSVACAEICAEHGVPVPCIVGSGVMSGNRPYTIETYVQHGIDADLVREPERRLQVWRNVGAVSAKIGRIPIDQRLSELHFGFDGNSPCEPWTERMCALEKCISSNERLGLNEEEKNRLINELREFDFERYPLGLGHGDFKLDNVKVDEPTLAVIAVLDWEFARKTPWVVGECVTTFEPAAFQVKKHAVAATQDERRAFVEGAGLDFDAAYRAFLPLFLAELCMNSGSVGDEYFKIAVRELDRWRR